MRGILITAPIILLLTALTGCEGEWVSYTVNPCIRATYDVATSQTERIGYRVTSESLAEVLEAVPDDAEVDTVVLRLLHADIRVHEGTTANAVNLYALIVREEDYHIQPRFQTRFDGWTFGQEHLVRFRPMQGDPSSRQRFFIEYLNRYMKGDTSDPIDFLAVLETDPSPEGTTFEADVVVRACLTVTYRVCEPLPQYLLDVEGGGGECVVDDL